MLYLLYLVEEAGSELKPSPLTRYGFMACMHA